MNATFTIKEQLGRDWTNELLHFPVTFEPGRQKDEHLTFFAAAGSDKPLPLATQVSDVQRHPDGSVASATAWCQIDLKAGQTLGLELKPAASPDRTDRPFWRKGQDGIEAGNGIFTVRLPAGGTYEPGAAPGPILAARVGQGQWMGRGSLQASAALVVKTHLLDSGPLFVRWQTTFTYERVTLARFVCTICAGVEIVRIEETSSYDSDLVLNFDCFPGLAPNRLLIGGGGHIGDNPNVRPIDYARPETLGTVDWNSGHHQMSLTWLGVFRDGGEGFLGLVEFDSGRWTNLSVNRIFLKAAPPESLLLQTPLQGGFKCYALVCSVASQHTHSLEGKKYNRLNDIHTRYTALPLQKVKDWVLEWEDREEPRPFLQCDRDGVAKARDKVQADPALRRPYEAWQQALAVKDDPNACPPGEPDWLEWAAAASAAPSARTTLWVALGDEKQARLAAEELDNATQKNIDRMFLQGGLMDLVILDGRVMKRWLQAYDVLKGHGFIEPDRDRRIKSRLAFLAYCMAEEEFFPQEVNLLDHGHPDSFYRGLGRTIGDAVCPPNFLTEYYTTYGMTGCTFRSHPQAGAWRKRAAALMERQLEVHYYESGGYCESPNYHSHSFIMTTQLAITLRRAGEKDFFQEPRYRNQYEWFVNMQTPPILINKSAKRFFLPWRLLDRDLERYAMLPGNGNTGSDGSDMPLPVELAVGAALMRDTHGELSLKCMTTWRRAGRPCVNDYDDLTFLLLADPTLPGVEPMGLSSTLLTGNYVTFRGNAETPDEVFVLTKNGSATHHNDFDEGGFTIWAYGAPAASDFGYHAEHQGRRHGVCDTWKHNCVEFDGKSSGYLGIEEALPPEKFVSTPLADLLVSYIPINNLRDLAHGSYLNQIPCERIEYRRFTLFVKPHYLLVFDSIQECKVSHKWWLHAQADDVQIDGPKVRFKGKFGVDLFAQFLLPSKVAIDSGEFSIMKHINATQFGAKDWRVFVAPLKGGQEFQVSSEDAGRVVRVNCGQYSDTIFLAAFPFHHAASGVHFHGRAGVVRTLANGQKQVQLLDGEELKA